MPAVRQTRSRHTNTQPPVPERDRPLTRARSMAQSGPSVSVKVEHHEQLIEDAGASQESLTVANGPMKSPDEEPAALPNRRLPPLRLEDLSTVKPLHNGGYSTVSLVHLARPRHPTEKTNTIFVLKSIRKQSARRMTDGAHNVERAVLTQLPWSPFIVNLITAFASPTHLHLLLEPFPHGSLRTLLDRGRMPIARAAFYFANLVAGLCFLHARGLAHGALRPEHALLGANGYLALTDFAHARTDDDARADDWWQAGVLLYAMLALIRPFLGADYAQVYWAPCVQWGRHLKDLMRRLLDPSPAARLGAHDPDDVRRHPWLGAVDWHKMENCLYTAPHVPGEWRLWEPGVVRSRFQFDEVPLLLPRAPVAMEAEPDERVEMEPCEAEDGSDAE